MQTPGAGSSFRVGHRSWILSESFAHLLPAADVASLHFSPNPPHFSLCLQFSGSDPEFLSESPRTCGSSPQLGSPPAPSTRRRGGARGTRKGGGSPKWTLTVADGESRESVEAERGRLRGWRKQSPQLSAEEGGGQRRSR